MFSLGFEKLVFLISPLPLDRMSKLWSGIYLKRDDAIKKGNRGDWFLLQNKNKCCHAFPMLECYKFFPIKGEIHVDLSTDT